jgi:prepilin-type N-terminal cleavage/methylation domain-containing protein
MNLSEKIKKGFTLIEILLVIAILSVLLVVVFASLRPQTRLVDARDARRWNDVNQYLTALHECIVDSDDGDVTDCGVTDDGTEREIVDGSLATLCDQDCTTVGATACEDLSSLVSSNYLASIIDDPSGPATADHTGYAITSSSGVVTIRSCMAEGGSPISVAR